jgi:hypothetical protein
MNGLLPALLFKQFPDGFIVHLRHKDVDGIRTRVMTRGDPSSWVSRACCCCRVSAIFIATSFLRILLVWEAGGHTQTQKEEGRTGGSL